MSEMNDYQKKIHTEASEIGMEFYKILNKRKSNKMAAMIAAESLFMSLLADMDDETQKLFMSNIKLDFEEGLKQIKERRDAREREIKIEL